MSREDWKETTLGELVKFNQNSVKKPDLDEMFTYVDIGSTSFELGIDSRSLVTMPFSKAPSRAKRLIHEGDVLLSTVRPNLRAMARVEKNQDGYVASTGFAVIRTADEETLLQDFLWILVRDEHFTNHLVNLATGSNYPAVKVKDISSYSLTLPPIEEQREIVSFMQALDLMIQAGDREISSAEQMREDIVIGLLFPSSPFETVNLGDVATVKSGFAFKSKDWLNEGVKVIKITNVKPGYLDLRESEVSFVSPEVAEKASNSLLLKGEIVVRMTGNVGDVAMHMSDEKVMVNQRVGKFVFHDPQVNRDFFFYATNNKWFREEVIRRGAGSAQKNVSPSAIESIHIPLPPLEEQEKIVEKMQTLDTYIDSAKRSQEALKQVRQDALHALLSGDKDVRDLAEMFTTDEDVA